MILGRSGGILERKDSRERSAGNAAGCDTPVRASLQLSAPSSLPGWSARGGSLVQALVKCVSIVSLPPVTAPSPEVSALAAVVRRAHAGDLAAQSLLVQRYMRRITGFVRRIVVQPSAVEDVVQTVFIKMVRRLGGLREVQTFESWLFALARNTALDHIRRRRCQPTAAAGELDENLVGPENGRGRNVDEIMSALEQALRRLSPRDRNIVRLIVAGNSYQVAAQREGLTVGAVKIRMHRVRPYLRLRVSEAIGVPMPTVKKWRAPRGCLAA